MPKFIHVVGARPNFMKIAPLISALSSAAKARNITFEQKLIHTGQHYTPEMSALMFEQLDLPQPDYNLEVGSGSHGQQTGRIMEAFEKILTAEKPDLVIVVGDVNSTIACALDARKMNIPVAHVEAGLRSFDREMPEEINRILTDAISDYLFTTEESARMHLIAEGIDPARIHFVGNTMIDTLLKHQHAAKSRPVLQELNLIANNSIKPYGIVTLHRPSNVDNRTVLADILQSLLEVSKTLPLILPLHPRTRSNIEKFELNGILNDGQFTVIEPQGYLDFLCLLANAKMVLSDSGGIQEEATVLGVPCLTLRENTERPVTLTEGTNILVGNKPANIIPAFERAMTNSTSGKIPKYWDGKAAERIAQVLFDDFN
jgi:UDP-N-acetylglucosamine 2-epimerase (non-hydrolysing)